VSNHDRSPPGSAKSGGQPHIELRATRLWAVLIQLVVHHPKAIGQQQDDSDGLYVSTEY
jgi:hypothetical protein